MRKPPSPPKPNAPLADAIKFVEAHMRVGVFCPCCGQFAKIYKRKLNVCMAYALGLIAREQKRRPNEWLHAPSYLHKAAVRGPTVRGGDFAKLVHWGALIPKPEIRNDGSNRAGFYKITKTGLDFVDGKIKLAKHIHLYAGRFCGFSTELTTFRQALGEDFDYDELMRA